VVEQVVEVMQVEVVQVVIERLVMDQHLYKDVLFQVG
jgi:hypothetical protein